MRFCTTDVVISVAASMPPTSAILLTLVVKFFNPSSPRTSLSSLILLIGMMSMTPGSMPAKAAVPLSASVAPSSLALSEASPTCAPTTDAPAIAGPAKGTKDAATGGTKEPKA